MHHASIDLDDLPSDPITLFKSWFAEAKSSNELVEAMALATSSVEARPSNRFVLLKQADDRGFVFFTNYESRKAIELETTGRAAAALFWPNPRRQVRIEGFVERLTESESDAYFRTRDRLSQIGAAVSPQSRVVRDRLGLDLAVQAMDEEMAGRPIRRPGHWGGYRLIPDTVEFWTGRDNRLHDRFRYRLASGHWTTERLAP